MAVEIHSPRGIYVPAPARPGAVRPGPAVPAPGVPRPARPAPALKAHGLAVWVDAGGADVDDAVLARAAELLLSRTLKFAPEGEVHLRTASGAATPAAPLPQQGPHDGGTPAPPSVAPPAAERPAAAPPSVGAATLVSVDLAAGEVRLDGQPVALTGVEFRLLRYLAENCSRPVGRDELRLFLESFDSSAAATRSIDVYVGRVRRKLRRGRHAIATVRGGGYQFVPGPRTKVRGPAEYSI